MEYICCKESKNGWMDGWLVRSLDVVVVMFYYFYYYCQTDVVGSSFSFIYFTLFARFRFERETAQSKENSAGQKDKPLPQSVSELASLLAKEIQPASPSANDPTIQTAIIQRAKFINARKNPKKRIY